MHQEIAGGYEPIRNLQEVLQRRPSSIAMRPDASAFQIPARSPCGNVPCARTSVLDHHSYEIQPFHGPRMRRLPGAGLSEHLDRESGRTSTTGNFSLFQSPCPTSWAIDQIFPVMPLIHRLKEAPTRQGYHRGHHLRLRRPDRASFIGLKDEESSVSSPFTSLSRMTRSTGSAILPGGSLSGDPGGDLHNLLRGHERGEHPHPRRPGRVSRSPGNWRGIPWPTC